MGSWSLYINIAACLPILNLIPTALKKDTGIPREWVNLLRMIRVLHFMPAFRELKRYCSRKREVNESMFRMGIIIFFAFLGLSVLGCLYFFISVDQYRSDGDDPSLFCDELNKPLLFELNNKTNTSRLDFLFSKATWISEDELITEMLETEDGGCNAYSGLFFVRSVYYMMQTLFTIGYGDTVVPNGDNVNEMYLACCYMLVGVFGYGLIIANMTSVLANVDVVSMRYRHEMDLLAKWMVVRSMPESLRERINVYFHYIFRKQVSCECAFSSINQWC